MLTPFIESVDWWLIAGMALGAAGVLLAVWALFKDRSRGRRRCPKCWYDMGSVPGLRCPECGRDAGREGRLLKTQRRWRSAAIALLLAGVGLAVALRNSLDDVRAWFTPALVLESTEQFNSWELRLYRRNDPRFGQVLDLRYGRKSVLRLADIRIWPGGDEGLPLGHDITGNGRPNLIVKTWAGGNSASSESWTIYELQDDGAVAAVAILPFGEFTDLDGDSIPEFVTRDPTFAYWWTSGADSPYPRVVLQFRYGRYVVARHLMLSDPPPIAELEARATADAARAENSIWLWVGTPLRTALDLIYTGNEAAAWHYLDAAWPEQFANEKEKRFDDLRAMLRGSPYAGEIRLLQER